MLEYIRRELRYRLEVEDHEVLLESATVLTDRSDTRGAVISLVNFRVSAYQGTGLGRTELLDSLELVILVSFRFKHYEDSVRHLYKTIRLFHAKPAYTAADTHPGHSFPSYIDKLLFTLSPMEFDTLNALWGMQGGIMFPSALYSVRMVRSQRAPTGG
ncbi:MAG: DUF4255 domain-containing protein [Thermoleophilia bacterium]|nr:DUF4255 domain-containing protein [Thermoleophilia bacterium]